MLELNVQCYNKVKVIDPKSTLSSVFGSKWATFYIDNKQKVSIMFKTGTFEYWKLIIKNNGLGGRKFLDVDYWTGWSRPTLKWQGSNPNLKIKLRPSFFGI